MYRCVTRKAIISAASQRASQVGIYNGKFTTIQDWIFNNFSTAFFNNNILSVDFLPSTRGIVVNETKSLLSWSCHFAVQCLWQLCLTSTSTENPTHTDQANHRASKLNSYLKSKTATPSRMHQESKQKPKERMSTRV